MANAALKVFADTSVLVAACVESHPAHKRCLPWLQDVRKEKIDLFICTHTLAELYAVLTSLPLKPAINPATARLLIKRNVEQQSSLIELRTKDYRSVLDRLSALNLSGGVIYDALAVQAARKAGVRKLLTLNESDFQRIWPEDEGKIITVP